MEDVMGITVRWYGESQSVILYTFVGDWTVDECMAAIEQSTVLRELRPCQNKLDTVVDMRNSGDVPSAIVRHLRRINGNFTQNKGLIIIVGLGSAARQILELVYPLMPYIKSRLRLVDTLQAADNLLLQQRIASDESIDIYRE
jgi:hypothetical protein